jgi:hypothetical protein
MTVIATIFFTFISLPLAQHAAVSESTQTSEVAFVRSGDGTCDSENFDVASLMQMRTAGKDNEQIHQSSVTPAPAPISTNDPITPDDPVVKPIASSDPVEPPDKGEGDSNKLPPTHPLVASCKALFEKTFAENCKKTVTVTVLSAEREVINGISIQMQVKVCGAAGACHSHHPECTYETSTDHTDAKLMELKYGSSDPPDPSDLKGFIPTLKLNVPLCDADNKDAALLESSSMRDETEAAYEDLNEGACLCGSAEKWLKGKTIPHWRGRTCSASELVWACPRGNDDKGKKYLKTHCCTNVNRRILMED